MASSSALGGVNFPLYHFNHNKEFAVKQYSVLCLNSFVHLLDTSLDCIISLVLDLVLFYSS